MRDAPRLEELELLPRARQQLVGDLLVRQRVEGVAADVLVHEHDRVRAEFGGRDQLGRVGPGGDGRVREQRLLLQCLAQRLEAAALGEAAQREPLPDAVEEALGLLLAVDDRHVERRAVLQGHDVAAATVLVAVVVAVRHVLGAQRGHRLEADAAQPRQEVLAGGPYVRGADGVQRAVGDGPADQHGDGDRERRGVAADQHREGVQEQHGPHRDAPARPARHADRRHIGDHGGEITVHGVRDAAARRSPGERVADRLGGGAGHPEIGGQRDAVREDGGEDAVGDPQPVALDEALHGERHGDDEDGDVGRQPREVGQQLRRLAGGVADVLLKAGGGAVGERGEREHQRQTEDAEEEPDQVGGAVHSGGQQRLVPGDPVDVGLFVLAAVLVGGVGSVGAGQHFAGALPLGRLRALLLVGLFLISYHQSPPGRWWHDHAVQGGIRVHFGGAEPRSYAASRIRTPTVIGSGGELGRCRWGAAGWVG